MSQPKPMPRTLSRGERTARAGLPSIDSSEEIHHGQGVRKAGQPQAIHPLCGKRVLLVEDSAFNRDVAVAFLDKVGVIVDVVENGRQAVDRFRGPHQAFDGVLMDLQLPEMDGWEATEAIRRCCPGRPIPIIALTAFDDPRERARCLVTGMSDYLVKPFSAEDLYRVLQRWLTPEDGVRRPRASSGLAPAAVGPSLGRTPVFDRQRALERLEGRAALLDRMLAIFVREFSEAASAIRACLAAGEVEEAWRLAHTIKGTAGLISTDRLHQAARDLEILLREERGECEGMLRRLEQELASAVREVNGYLSDQDPSPDGSTTD